MAIETTTRARRRWLRRPQQVLPAAHEDRNSLIGHAHITPYLLSGPAIFMVSGLLAFPVLYSIWRSLFYTEFVGGREEFVGVQNYIDLLSSHQFQWSLSRTAIFVFGCLLLGITLSLAFAFALNKAGKRLRFLRGITIMPYLVSGVAAAVMFRLVFNQEFGMVNRVLEFFGVDGPQWFASPTLAMVAVIVAQTWTDVPLAILLLLGGLQTIDPSLLDAAEVDGATGWTRAWKISIPLVTPQLVLATVWFSYATLTSLGVTLAMTRGGPVNATSTLPVLLYNMAFQQLRYNEALALVIIVLLINAGLTLLYVAAARKVDLGN